MRAWMVQPLFALPLLRVAASGAPPQGLPPHGGGACATDWDCSLGGTCAGSKCQCDAWFTGHNCTLLNLAPARHGNGFDLSGLSSGGDSFHGPRWTGWSSWGGHAVRDNSSSGWVGVFSLMARGCGLHAYHSNSESVIATAPEVDGPYTLLDPTNPDAPGNIAVAAPSHCTQVKKHPSGDYHLWHIFPGAADNASSPDAGPPELSCTNGTRLRATPPPPPKPCPATGCIPPKNQQLFVHTAPTPRGPWSTHGTPIHLETLNETTISQSSCSAPFYHPNGSVTLVVGGAACPQGWGGSGGAHGGGGGCLWEFFAESWQGPYRQVARPTGDAGDPITHPENEDPAVFTDPRGNFHMLTNVNTGHRRCGSGTACGGHAWSRNGVSWSDTFIGAFGPNGKMTNGSNFSLGYVERPQIAQEAPGKAPLALFLSAGPKYLAGATFTWAQRFCDAEALAAGQCGFMGGVPWDGPQPKPPDAATPPPPPSTGEAAPTCSNWTSGMDVNCCNIAQSGPHTQAECCAMCHANPKCAAVVWNAGSDKWCNLKWSAADHQRRSKGGEMLARIRPDQPRPAPPPSPPPTRPQPPPSSQPDWVARYRSASLLYADAAAVAEPKQQHLMPEVGNGFVAAKAHGRASKLGDYLMVGGVYNGRADSGDKELDGPSHRAQIPSFLPSVEGASAATASAHTALDMERAAFITRGTVGSGVAVEQRLYAHWTRPHLLVQEFHLASSAPGEVSFTAPKDEALWSSGIDFSGTSLSPAKPGLRIVTGSTRISETATSNTTLVAMVSTAPAPVRLRAGGNTTVFVLHAVSTSLNGSTEPSQVLAEAMGYHAAGVSAAPQLWQEHTAAWQERWADGRIEVGGDLALAQSVNASLYFLLSAIREDWPFGLSPGGLASSDYFGHVFWDMDTWMYPPLAALHPELGRGCLEYRKERAPVARANAQAHGYNGTMFPWESSLTGIETSPAGDGTHGACSAPGAPPPPPLRWFDAELPAATDPSGPVRSSAEIPRVSTGNAFGDCEQHINSDISFATRQMWQLSHDEAWLADTGYPLAEGIAEFWASKATRGADGLYHILKVMGPDEFHQLVDDNSYTNAAAATALRFAADAAAALGKTPPSAALWREIADRMFIPYDAAKDYHPEYMAYYPKAGKATGVYAPPEVVKQGDTILMGFPLGWNMTASSRRNDLIVYNNYTTATGPAMTWAMFAVGYLDIGDEATALSFFRRGYLNALDGAFGVWQETPSGGAVNFLTGAGGFLQSVIFGYGGLRLSDDELLLRPPHPPGAATSVRLRGVDYLGVPLSITATADTLVVERLAGGADSAGLGAVALELKDGSGGPAKALRPGAPVTVPRAGGATVARAKS